MKCYFRSNVQLLPVPPDLVSWTTEFVDYHPPYYTSQTVLKNPEWADSESTEEIKFNQIDGKINRISFTGVYAVVNGYPRNPKGRIGITGRGLLGKWGPNHAVDIAICRWKTNRKIECIRIKRKDNGRTAYPGGMVDDGETFEDATIREAMEEVFNLPDQFERNKAHQWLLRNVPKAVVVYRGYISDHRSTDNAWIETNLRVCLEQGNDPVDFSISPGDDAADAFWQEIPKVPSQGRSTEEMLKSLFGY